MSVTLRREAFSIAETLAAVADWQADRGLDPLMCGTDSRHPNLAGVEVDGVVGLRCSVCCYRQTPVPLTVLYLKGRRRHWVLVKDARSAQLLEAPHPAGRELRCLVGAELRWSRVFPLGAYGELLAESETVKASFQERGWESAS